MNRVFLANGFLETMLKLGRNGRERGKREEISVSALKNEKKKKDKQRYKNDMKFRELLIKSGNDTYTDLPNCQKSCSGKLHILEYSLFKAWPSDIAFNISYLKSPNRASLYKIRVSIGPGFATSSVFSDKICLLLCK